MEPGDFVKFEDGGKHHLAVLLSSGGGRAWALFLTSRPGWNPGSRPLADRDLEATGHVPGRETWLAPVVRPTEGMSPVGLPGVGRASLARLLEEFGPDPTFLPRCVERLPGVRAVRPSFPRESALEVVRAGLRGRSTVVEGGESVGAHLSDPVRFGMSAMFLAGLWPLSHVLTSWFVSLVPALDSRFFVRKPSMTFAVQTNWIRFAGALRAARTSKGASAAEVSAVLGVPPSDLLDFESGVQCPSWREFLFLRHAYGGFDPSVGFPNQVPSWESCVARSGSWRALDRIQSASRISRERMDRILIHGYAPSAREVAGFRLALPWLPHWRQSFPSLDEGLSGVSPGVSDLIRATVVNEALDGASKALGVPVPRGMSGSTFFSDMGRLSLEACGEDPPPTGS